MSNSHESLPDNLRKMSLDDDEEDSYSEGEYSEEDEDSDNGRIENKTGHVPSDPVKMNKTLTLEYMLKYEPFKVLPTTYFPMPKFDHRPVFYIYGFGFRYRDLRKYAKKNGISSPADEIEGRPELSNAWLLAASALIQLAAGEFGVCMDLCLPYSKEADVVLKLWDNYCKQAPRPGRETILKAIVRVQDVLEAAGIYKQPKWYISEPELGREGYGKPIDFCEYFPVTPAPAETAVQ